ncbi:MULTISPECIES: pyruvate kinase [Thiorhodovibrio]|uniref:pyruvate kinase n=1 Tax=Thiorhodovibrio TaxID=61593 RepID=UPI0019147774|nr:MULTISPECIES: pyruvate kinase [Thiorhodovibrio]MBK5967995.1 pyruvate kinase [Thiorhodovibrio winogradskyi]WPL11811.1 Pyruvate kinase [Thiorhodovibrio litoralis]
MQFRSHKTKIVATIGPASDHPEVLRQMIDAGLNIARLNFSHGDPASHAERIARIREAGQQAGQRVVIMGDLPGPKMRIGDLAEEPVELVRDNLFTLTTEDILGDGERASVTFKGLPAAVKPGDRLFLNDGFILLKVVDVSPTEVVCNVRAGGELRSRKGLNLPGIDLGISAFTEEDHDWLRFAAEQQVDAVSQSFVASADDIQAVRGAAAALDYHPFIIAKIERADALEDLEAILDVSDGIMVARGDLGVEIPIESIAVAQRRITEQANLCGKPVITATQMLESMVLFRRPTRAEATDVANAILGGTDCVMLSAESAMGRFPIESVAMLAAIATATEPERDSRTLAQALGAYGTGGSLRAVDLIARSVYHTVERSAPHAIIVPTRSGNTARSIARFRLREWIVAFSPLPTTCQALEFSYGVQPIDVREDRAEWGEFVRAWLRDIGLRDGLVLLTQGPSDEYPCGNHRLELIELDRDNANACQ